MTREIPLTASLWRCVLVLVVLSTASPCEGSTQTTGSPIIARVLSTDPFIFETLEDPTNGRSALYTPRPISGNIKHSPDEIKHLRYGDIISATVYSYLTAGRELGIGTGITNVRRLDQQAKSEYSKTGFLIYYLRLTNNPNSYLTIYRDGTVLCHDTPGNYITNKVLSKGELRKLVVEFAAEGIDDLPSESTLKETDPTLISSIGRYQQLDLTNPSPNLKRFLARLDTLIEGYISEATYRISYYRRFLIKDWPYANIIALDEITDSFGDA